MDSDRTSIVNHAEQSPVCRSIWSTRRTISLSALAAPQDSRSPRGNDSRQPAGVSFSRYPHLHLLAANTAFHPSKTGNHHRLPRLIHDFFHVLCRECPADQSRTATTGSIQYTSAGSDRAWSCPAWDLDWLPALHLLKKTPTSPHIDDTEIEQEEEKGEKEPRRFHCQACDSWIAFVSDIIQIDDIPILTLQINPHGFVHEVITVRYVVHCLIVGPPVPADTWFPGYEWRFLICQQCRSHLGWSYHRPNENSMRFAGLRKASIIEK